MERQRQRRQMLIERPLAQVKIADLQLPAAVQAPDARLAGQLIKGKTPRARSAPRHAQVGGVEAHIQPRVAALQAQPDFKFGTAIQINRQLSVAGPPAGQSP